MIRVGSFREDPRLDFRISTQEFTLFRRTREEVRGHAVAILGINRKTLSHKITKYGIAVDDA